MDTIAINVTPMVIPVFANIAVATIAIIGRNIIGRIR
jgi:hypothetical protein